MIHKFTSPALFVLIVSLAISHPGDIARAGLHCPTLKSCQQTPCSCPSEHEPRTPSNTNSQQASLRCINESELSCLSNAAPVAVYGRVNTELLKKVNDFDDSPAIADHHSYSISSTLSGYSLQTYTRYVPDGSQTYLTTLRLRN